MTFRALNDVAPRDAFTLKNGKKIRSLHELSVELSAMDERAFSFHLRRMHIPHWIRNKVGDPYLASKVAMLTERNKISRAIQDRVLGLEHLRLKQPPSNLVRSLMSEMRDEYHLRANITWGLEEFLIGATFGLVAGMILGMLF